MPGLTTSNVRATSVAHSKGTLPLSAYPYMGHPALHKLLLRFSKRDQFSYAAAFSGTKLLVRCLLQDNPIPVARVDEITPARLLPLHIVEEGPDNCKTLAAFLALNLSTTDTRDALLRERYAELLTSLPLLTRTDRAAVKQNGFLVCKRCELVFVGHIPYVDHFAVCFELVGAGVAGASTVASTTRPPAPRGLKRTFAEVDIDSSSAPMASTSASTSTPPAQPLRPLRQAKSIPKTASAGSSTPKGTKTAKGKGKAKEDEPCPRLDSTEFEFSFRSAW
ncbi:hypothetical protein MKEN_00988200 [Mycena kentingensis (nom. inval.)]|nr:hypothetical protein MKEN_00988200 [Mycena kentingensis (nom. inval.)]